MSNPQATLAEQFQQLEALTKELESGELDLEQAIPKFEQGVQLAKVLKQKLKEMENRIETLSADLEPEDKED